MCQSKTSVLKLKVNTTSYETLVAGLRFLWNFQPVKTSGQNQSVVTLGRNVFFLAGFESIGAATDVCIRLRKQRPRAEHFCRVRCHAGERFACFLLFFTAWIVAGLERAAWSYPHTISVLNFILLWVRLVRRLPLLSFGQLACFLFVGLISVSSADLLKKDTKLKSNWVLYTR